MFRCVTQHGRLFVIPAQDIVQLLKNDFVLKTEIKRLIDSQDVEKSVAKR